MSIPLHLSGLPRSKAFLKNSRAVAAVWSKLNPDAPSQNREKPQNQMSSYLRDTTLAAYFGRLNLIVNVNLSCIGLTDRNENEAFSFRHPRRILLPYRRETGRAAEP